MDPPIECGCDTAGILRRWRLKWSHGTGRFQTRGKLRYAEFSQKGSIARDHPGTTDPAVPEALAKAELLREAGSAGLPRPTEA